MYKLTYFGCAAFHIQLPDGRGILMDPYLDFGPVKAEELPRVDFISISHGASDHIGRGFEVAKLQGCDIYAPPGVLEYAMIQGLPEEKLHVMAQGAVRVHEDIALKAVPASHVSFMRIGGGRFITDCPLGYIITLPDGLKIYHTGDTSIFSDLKLIGELYKPDIVLLPCGEFAPGYITEIDPEEAALAATWIGAKKIFPMHYDLNEQAENPQRLITRLKELKYDAEITVMKPGESVEI